MSLYSRPLVIAHRGASGTLPENTLPAYALALEDGADMIEIDLHRTADGEIVITHDEGLEHLGGRGEIAGATFAEVRALDAGGGEVIPTLDEVLDRFGARIPFNLELKRGSRAKYEGLEVATLAAVERRGLLAQTLFSSFDDGVLETLRERSPEARLGVLVGGRRPFGWLDRARGVGAETVHFWLRLVDAGTVRRAHAEGLAVLAYTVDDPNEMERLLALQLDGIFSNYPERLRAVVGPPAGPWV